MKIAPWFGIGQTIILRTRPPELPPDNEGLELLQNLHQLIPRWISNRWGILVTVAAVKIAAVGHVPLK